MNALLDDPHARRQPALDLSFDDDIRPLPGYSTAASHSTATAVRLASTFSQRARLRLDGPERVAVIDRSGSNERRDLRVLADAEDGDQRCGLFVDVREGQESRRVTLHQQIARRSIDAERAVGNGRVEGLVAEAQSHRT